MVPWEESDFFAQPAKEARVTSAPKEQPRTLLHLMRALLTCDVCLPDCPKDFHRAHVTISSHASLWVVKEIYIRDSARQIPVVSRKQRPALEPAGQTFDAHFWCLPKSLCCAVCAAR